LPLLENKNCYSKIDKRSKKAYFFTGEKQKRQNAPPFFERAPLRETPFTGIFKKKGLKKITVKGLKMFQESFKLFLKTYKSLFKGLQRKMALFSLVTRRCRCFFVFQAPFKEPVVFFLPVLFFNF